MKTGETYLTYNSLPRGKSLTDRIAWGMQDLLPDTMGRTTKAFIWSLPIVASVFVWNHITDDSDHDLYWTTSDEDLERGSSRGMDPFADESALQAILSNKVEYPEIMDANNRNEIVEAITSIRADTPIGRAFVEVRPIYGPRDDESQGGD